MRSILLLFILFHSVFLYAQKIQNIYCLPGQGSDERIFKNLTLDTSFNIVCLQYTVPFKNETMTQYAERMSCMIDTTETFAVIGVSLGGMLACEMTRYVHPDKVILISSASSSEEIPSLYTFFDRYPLQRSLPAWIFKASTMVLQPLYEPDRRSERRTCNAMILDKNAEFMKQGVDMIAGWKRKENENAGLPIIQINGDNDHTLPLENISADYIIPGGSHMMTLTRASEISAIINAELHK